MPPPRVGVIGAGVSGSVLAILLKLKGYDPVLYERNEGVTEAGLGIGIQRNGLRVLDKIPGLLDHLHGFPRDEWHYYSVLEQDKGLLGATDYPKRQREKDGYGMIGYRRQTFITELVEFATKKSGVPIHWQHKLESLEQDEDSVTVTFANGVRESFSFVVGCDGIHSNTRCCLFGRQPANYTGIVEVGGFSPTPPHFRGKNLGADVFGDGATMIITPLEDNVMIWAVSLRESEAKEAWRNLDDVAAESVKSSAFSKWDFGAGDIVRNSFNIVKYGSYDRPELKSWHKGRVLLIGDAAHPTSPHLGQGANQSLEDVDLLMELFEKHNPSASALDTATLDMIFTKLEAVRIPRSSEMVKAARVQGELRVAQGTEACIARNNRFRDMCKDPDGYKKRFGA